MLKNKPNIFVSISNFGGLLGLLLILWPAILLFIERTDCLSNSSCRNITLSDGFVMKRTSQNKIIISGFIPPFYFDERWKSAVSDLDIGDTLVQIDRLTIYNDSTRFEVLRSSEPNEPIRYQFSRPNIRRTAILITPLFQPVLVPFEDVTLFYSLIVVAIISFFVSLSYLIAIISVWRFGKKHPMIEILIVMSLLLYSGLLLFRTTALIHIYYKVFVLIEFYLFFISIFLIFILLNLLSFPIKSTFLLLKLVFYGLCVCLLIFFGISYWIQGEFLHIQELFMFVFIGLVGILLAEAGRTRYRLFYLSHPIVSGQLQGNIAMIGLGLMLWGCSLYCLAIDSSFLHPSTLTLVALVGILFPTTIVAYPIIRIANMRVIITRIIVSLMILSIFVGFFLLLMQFEPLVHVLAPLPRMFVVGIIVSGLSYAFLKVYLRFERIIDRYISRDQQARYETLLSFLAKMPRFKHSNQLIAETEVQLARYANTSFCLIWTNQMPNNSTLGWNHKELCEIYHQLSSSPNCWSAITPLSGNVLDEAIAYSLMEQKVEIVYPIRLNQAMDEGIELFGLVLIGKKKGEGYNLSDIEAMRQVAQQLGLSLDILYLLEREKDLISRKLDLEKQTMEANLRALRAQINPHFLFNTFNSISDLIHVAPNRAEIALERLAFIIRYTLQSSKQEMVELGAEMELVKTYLSLEELRFGDRLTTSIEVEPSCTAVLVPALIIQTIVENCIKHGTSKVVRPGYVSIRVTTEGDCIQILVSDNGPGIDLTRIEKGTGLLNSMERLQSIYNRNDLLIFQNNGHGTDVTLLIPTISRFHNSTLSVS